MTTPDKNKETETVLHDKKSLPILPYLIIVYTICVLLIDLLITFGGIFFLIFLF